ncbi:phosphotransferase [Cognatishimia activa]|uniref:Phosphotransferase n=1 Tax=Cognatishimia activa TaxID=1715691 RepID=A0A975ELS0_9RHOB|nr:phosphotransferase [Cognatishimia activa]QTN34478.1 phosphotransferase [Cognatishimia activa]
MIQTAPLPSAQLRHIVSEVEPWTVDGHWSVLFGGRTNTTWQVAGEDQCLVLKLYRAASGNPLFPNDAQAESLMLRHLAGLGIAPELVTEFDAPEGYCTLYHAIPGDPWRENVAEVADMMRKLHAQPVPSGLRRIPNGSAEILEHADHILSRCHQHIELSELRPLLDVPPTDETVLLHCDMVPGNLITNEAGLHLIDWQCPGVGDPCEDMAIFVSPAMQGLYRGSALSAEELDGFLACIPQHEARYRSLAPAYHYRMAAYCAWKVEQGTPDYAAGYEAEVAALKG